MSWRFVLAACCGLLPAASRADDIKPADQPAKFAIPYKLTDTKHVLVRAKINGKGPFNMILDTGAPGGLHHQAARQESGRQTDDKGWGTFTTFEIEGGLKVNNVKTRVEDLVQIDGMNSMGLAGVELHGVIGYNVLARFRIEYDFTADKLCFEKLAGFTPPPPEKIEARGATTSSRWGR